MSSTIAKIGMRIKFNDPGSWYFHNTKATVHFDEERGWIAIFSDNIWCQLQLENGRLPWPWEEIDDF